MPEERPCPLCFHCPCRVLFAWYNCKGDCNRSSLHAGKLRAIICRDRDEPGPLTTEDEPRHETCHRLSRSRSFPLQSSLIYFSLEILRLIKVYVDVATRSFRSISVEPLLIELRTYVSVDVTAGAKLAHSSTFFSPDEEIRKHRRTKRNLICLAARVIRLFGRDHEDTDCRKNGWFRSKDLYVS